DQRTGGRGRKTDSSKKSSIEQHLQTPSSAMVRSPPPPMAPQSLYELTLSLSS
ncbi:7465_t:CDS:2, partial [Paraglomus occultum]